MYSTNDFDTFIEVAADCPVTVAAVPPAKDPRSAVQIEYEMLIDSPYEYTSDDVLYESNGARRGITREDFFAKPQPCFRASTLGKKYGWGVHADTEGKIAIYAIESDDYQRLAADPNIKHLEAMRSSRK
ncbi:MAG: DUF6157 family protein [Propionibacteriaceae bacterium]|nr:DUF6157 family protein [Propionibacteriaceae bacterium]